MKHLLSLTFTLLLAVSINAATFTVNSNADTSDANTADGICLDANGVCTLRAAIEQANALASDDLISFDLSVSLIRLNASIFIGESSATTTTIDGGGAKRLTIDGAGATRLFVISGASSVTIKNLTITGGNGIGEIGFTNGGNGSGGAIFLYSSTLTLDGVHITGNTSRAGGGIFNRSGSLTVINSTFSYNTTMLYGGAILAEYGGVSVINSTISGNAATAIDGTGGAIFVVLSGSVNIKNSTVTDNSAAIVGGVYVHQPSTPTKARASNSIISGNTNGDFNFFESDGYNLLPAMTSNTKPTDVVGLSPLLGNLQDNGGQTPTHELLPGSPAINAGNNANAPAFDQRGLPRIVGGTIDIGAFEVQTITCDFTINPTNQAIGSSGGNITVNITGVNGCSRTAVSNANWITVISGSSGSGSGTVTLSVQANTGSARTGTVTIAGQTFTVNQASGLCTFTLSPTSASLPSNAGTGNFDITVPDASCAYTAVSNDSFISITSGASGTGNGTVSFSVAANTGTARTGTITVGGQTFIVTQASGCTFTLSPTNANVPGFAGTASFNITGSAAGCSYTAVSNSSFITITSGASGNGNGTISFSVTANTTGAIRTGTITAGGQTFTISQAALPTLSINNNTLNEGNSGTTAFTFTVSLSAASSQAVTVNYATADGTAITGEDYTAASGTITFAPGEVNKTLTVLVSGDTVVEDNETFFVNLSNASNATIAIGQGTGTILNDDSCSYSISPTSMNANANVSSGNTIAVTTQAGCAYTAASNDSFITITSGASGTGNGMVGFTVAANTGAARTGTIIIAGQTFTVNQATGIAARRTAFDFDGDGKADISVFRPDGGVWYLLQSQNGFTGAQFGVSTDKIVPADYDGDGKTDLAVYRGGIWYLQRSTAGFTGISFGAPDDIPQPADFDGDGKAELAVYRPSNGVWYVLNLVNSQFSFAQFGAATDLPVVGDYDGDGKANFAVFRPSNGFWYIAKASGTPSQNFDSIQLGVATDKPVPADYDGDGKTDVAVYRPSNGTWYLQRSQLGFTGIQFGIATDLPVAADYDGDGKADVAVYRSGVWYLNRTTAGFTGVQFGTPTDRPVPNAFVP